MTTNVKQVMSMLASNSKITIFTATGEIIDMAFTGIYDTNKISDFISPLLTGKSPVDIDLSKYIKVAPAMNLDDMAKAGIVMTHIINGKTVQGVFFPTVMAVEVTVGENKVVIPHIDNLQAHMARAAADGSPSVINFFKRLAPVIQARKHSGEDLMKFIKKSEMPLTNSGRIIAYKRVIASSDEGYVTDCHTKIIKQRVGSRVSMRVDLVDSSRHNSCSTGLHVANLGYLGSFYGDKTLIVLVDPENFIAVPQGEDTKARVCSYDIIGMMSANTHKTVTSGNHVSGDQSFEQLIASAVNGTHIQPFEEIFVQDKDILKVVNLEINKVTSPIEDQKPTNGKSLSEDKVELVEESKTVNVLEKARQVKANTEFADTMGLPKDVYEAFILLSKNETKTNVAKTFNTSTRSISRWMEKHDYEKFCVEYKKLNEQKYDVYVTNANNKFISLIKGIRACNKLSLVESKNIAERRFNNPIRSNLSIVDAVVLTDSLKNYGQTVVMVKHGEASPVSEELPIVEPKKDEEIVPMMEIKNTTEKTHTIIEEARFFYNTKEYAKLWAFKKKKKKSWNALGFNLNEETIIFNNTPT
jgi:ribosomal protein L7/L12